MTTPTAPPQTPDGQARALALAQQNKGVEVAQGVTLMNIAGREGVERFETVVTIPADYQYRIPIKGVKKPNGDWDNDVAKVGLLSDGYDYLNRVIGATFFIPPQVHDDDGVMQPNPIHRGDMTLLRLGAIWTNPMGQTVMAIEDVKVDFTTMWMEKRANAKSAHVVRDEKTKQVLFDEFGHPMLALSDDDEMDAIKDLYRNRSNGMRYTYTVARTRLLKLATGIRSLPIDWPTDFKVRVVGFRDYLTPQERIANAAGDAAHLFGQAPDIEPLSSKDMGETEALSAAGAVDDLREETQQAEAAEPKVTGAPKAGVVCGAPEVSDPETGETVEGSFCMDVLDSAGTHPLGPHHFTSGGVGPR